MITCSLEFMAWRAMRVICKDACNHSLLTSRITIRLLPMMMKGVASIDSTMAASTGLSNDTGTRLLPWASVSNTKPNSPACAR